MTVTAQQGDATLEQEISAVGKESPLPALASLHDLQYFDSLQAFSYSTSPTANLNCTPFVRQYGILFRKWGVFVCQRDNESTTERRR